VDGLGEHLLAGAALADDQDVHIRERGQLGQLDPLDEDRGAARQIIEGVAHGRSRDAVDAPLDVPQLGQGQDVPGAGPRLVEQGPRGQQDLARGQLDQLGVKLDRTGREVGPFPGTS